MHGAARPRTRRRAETVSRERRARCSSPGATVRSVIGSTPRNARPITISTKPAISGLRRLGDRRSRSPQHRRRAATKTTVKPTTNGTLAATTRPPTRRSPRRARRRPPRAPRDSRGRAAARTGSAPTPGRRERRRGASQASNCCSAASTRASSSGEAGGSPCTSASPARPGARATSTRRRSRARRRPRRPPRAGASRRAGRTRASRARRERRFRVRDQLVLDLLLRPAPAAIRRRISSLHLLRDGRVRLVERLVTGRTDELRLELGLGWVLLARDPGRGERERDHRERDNGNSQVASSPLERNARLMPLSMSCRVAGPTMCGSATRPFRSMKNVSGYPVTP